MVSSVFKNARARARNEAGGVAYARSAEAALAQLVVTGCFNDTFYASAETQLDEVLDLARRVEPRFLAQAAVYGRETARMKDAPALLAAVLATRDVALLGEVFDRVVDDARMLRGWVQIVRSGVTGRRSLGSAPKRLAQDWLTARKPEQLFRQSVGSSPSLGDVIKLARPRPTSDTQRAMFGYLIDKDVDREQLPDVVRAYERFRREGGEMPDVPFGMLTCLELGPAEWTLIAERATWTQLRMNLNTFLRQGVFEDKAVVKRLAARLRDPVRVRGARAYPYQLLAAYMAASSELPRALRKALHDAMEVAVENVPALAGEVVVCPDVSGSMSSPVTGFRRGATSKVRCVDVAGLMTAAVLRRNPDAEVLAFDTEVRDLRLEPRDTVMTNAQRLSEAWGGGTDCSAPLRDLNRRGQAPDVVIMVSDNESWVGGSPRGGDTNVMHEWRRLRGRNRAAKLVCIDIQPYTTTQAPSGNDVLNVGGFSDAVFDVVARFTAASASADHWLDLVREVEI
ncbi:MAG: VWA domain-containing protein [Myxococcota bacterium]